MSGVRKEVEELRRILEEAKLGGGVEAINKQHAAGKLTARERLELLFDDGRYTEFDMLVTHRATEFGMSQKKAYGDGVVTAFGRVGGRNVIAIAQDFTFMGGSVGEMHATKIVKAMQFALSVGSTCCLLK
jgi:acetyl-CoA carboxylase carboxyltransferase component